MCAGGFEALINVDAGAGAVLDGKERFTDDHGMAEEEVREKGGRCCDSDSDC